MKILLIPDLHLGAGTSIGKDLYNTGLNSRVQDQKDLLDFILAKAESEQVDRLVVLGDIWESPKPNPTVVHIFLEWLLEASESFTIDIIQGNHDFIRGGANKISMLDCIKLAEIPNCNIHTEIGYDYTDGNYMVYVPFTDREQIGAKTTLEAQQMLQAQIKEVIHEDIADGSIMLCFGHLALEGSMWVGNEVADDHNEIFVTKKMMQDLNFDRVFMGHVHKHQTISKRYPFMQHVGSLDRTKFTGPDSTDKYITIYQDGTRQAPQRIKLPCRNLVDIPIKVPSTERNETDFVINTIELADKPLENSIVRIKIEASSSEYKHVDRKRISDFLSDKGVFNITSITETKHNEQVLKNDVGIDENIDHYNAIDIFVDGMTGSDDFKNEVKKVCKSIIKGVQQK